MIRVVAAVQGSIAVLALLGLRVSVLAVLRALEVVDDPTIVTKQSDLAPAFVSSLLFSAAIGLGIVILAFAVLAGTICTLLWKQRRHRLCKTLCIVECLCIPIGTVPGALTLALLDSPSVAKLFDQPEPEPQL